MTVTTAMPVLNAKATARTRKIFFMTIPLFVMSFPEPARGIRDSHHV
jgi:hypothetical protein